MGYRRAGPRFRIEFQWGWGRAGKFFAQFFRRRSFGRLDWTDRCGDKTPRQITSTRVFFGPQDELPLGKSRRSLFEGRPARTARPRDACRDKVARSESGGRPFGAFLAALRSAPAADRFHRKLTFLRNFGKVRWEK